MFRAVILRSARRNADPSAWRQPELRWNRRHSRTWNQGGAGAKRRSVAAQVARAWECAAMEVLAADAAQALDQGETWRRAISAALAAASSTYQPSKRRPTRSPDAARVTPAVADRQAAEMDRAATGQQGAAERGAVNPISPGRPSAV